MARVGASQRGGASQKGASRCLEAPFMTIYGMKRCLPVPGGAFLGGSSSLGGSLSRHAFKMLTTINQSI